MENIYLLLGPEEGEKHKFINTYIEKIKKQIGENPEVEKVYPFDTSMLDIVSGLQNVSLFSKYRIVILNNAEEVKQGNGLNVLLDYCKDPSPNTTLFLLSESLNNISKKLDKTVPKKQTVLY